MSEEESISEMKEKLEILEEAEAKELSWFKYLSLATVIIAVVAAVASLASGTYSNDAVLEKNNAVLFQNKASDQWSYYQAKGVKKNIADSFAREFGSEKFKEEASRYEKEQTEIKVKAEEFTKEVDMANGESAHFLEKHHKMAFSVTFFQISIALMALSSLMKRRSFFVISLLFASAGAGYLIFGFII